jgi:RNA polymerase sigma-70 factor, ECF subfamily
MLTGCLEVLLNTSAARLRTPREGAGLLPNASLPPPPATAGTNPCDALLLSALVDRDEAALRTAFDLCFAAMLRIALVHVGTRAIAEEVIQDTWLAALEAVARFEGRSSVRTWLFRILRNVARARGRREARVRPFSELAAAPAAEAAPAEPPHAVVAAGSADAPGRTALWATGSDPEQQLLGRELAQRVDAAIAGLPPRQREILVLRDVEGWSAADVCNVLGLSDTNQRVLLHRARNRVRSRLRTYLADGGCEDSTTDDMR